MKKQMQMILFIILQIIAALSNMFDLRTIEILSKTVLAIYVFSYFFVIKETKNKSINIYLIISLLFSIFYGYNIQLGILELFQQTICYIYCPITVIYILEHKKELNDYKQRIQLGLVLLTSFLGISTIISFIFQKEISLTLSTIITIIYPFVLSKFDKEKNITNIIFLIISTTSILLSNYNVLIISVILILLTYVTKSIKIKKDIITSLIYFIIPMAYIILFRENIKNVTFVGQKSLIYMLLEIVLYYLPFLYIFINYFKKFKKSKRKTFELLLIFISLIITFILGIYISNIFYSSLLIIVYSLIANVYLNKLSMLRKKVKEDTITIMALHLGYGGIEQYLSSLTMMLKEEYNIEIISTYKIMEEPAFNFENVNITYLLDDKPNKEELKNSIKSKNIFKILKEGLKAANIIYQKKYLNIDKIENINSKYIITTRDFHNELVGIYGRNDIIKIATEHNYHNNDEKYIKKVINSVKDIDYFILVSEILKDFYNDKVNPKCLFIPNVIDNLPNKSSNCKKHNLISIGRLSKEKGQKDLIDVVALLKEKYKDIKLYLVGDGPEKNELNKYIKENKLSKNVELTGFLNKNDIELKILNSSIFVTTSYTESFGLVVIEACSYKLPVVAFDSATGVKKLLENENGILVQNRDKKQMAKEISRLFEDEKLKEKISENGYKSCQQYLAKNVKKKWMNLIK